MILIVELDGSAPPGLPTTIKRMTHEDEAPRRWLKTLPACGRKRHQYLILILMAPRRLTISQCWIDFTTPKQDAGSWYRFLILALNIDVKNQEQHQYSRIDANQSPMLRVSSSGNRVLPHATQTCEHEPYTPRSKSSTYFSNASNPYPQTRYSMSCPS